MTPPPVNILLVDDEVRNLDVLESLLHSPDYNLVRALTAERALMLLLDGEFAAIVLDIHMPDMSGIELASLIKQRRRTQHIPIIFLTAYFQEDKDVLEGYGSGAVDYLTKPVNPQILRSKIGVFVDLFRKTRALAAANAALEQEVQQRQAAEESLRQANNELESRVRARTADLLLANEELFAREAQLRLVTDYAPVFITQIDRQHRFKFVNRTYARRFGFEPHEVIGKHFTEVMGEELYRTVKPHLDAALAGQRVEFEAEVAYASLGARWVFVVHEPERAVDGSVVGLVAVTTDITERKQAEQAVAAARDKALAASRAKDEFLARLSHELRTPLNPVLLVASDAARDPAIPDHARATFEMIRKNVELEARLIDDLLDLTGIARGKIMIRRRDENLHAILRDALAMVRSDFEQRKITLDVQLDAACDQVLADAARLVQVFLNLLKNAAKFTPADGRVTLRTSENDDRIVVRLSDSGIGMTEAEIARAFGAFEQGDHAANLGSRRFGGLGLGLAISRRLVEMHGGRISALSPGREQGSTFIVELPLRTATPAVPLAPPVPATTSRVRVSGEPKRILLVEDHEPTRKTLEQLLRRRNFSVVSAASVHEANLRAAESSFDLLVSDLGLPDGDGAELMASMRDRFGLVGIALTGYGMEQDVARCRAAGFLAHLTKPIRVESLESALAEVTGAPVSRR